MRLLSDEKFYNSNNHSLAVTTVSLVIEIVLIQMIQYNTDLYVCFINILKEVFNALLVLNIMQNKKPHAYQSVKENPSTSQ